MSAATKEEPIPKATAGVHIWDLVIADVARMRDSTSQGPLGLAPRLQRVIDDMRERDAMGAARYGTHLQADNGRNPLVDAYQETLDRTVYLKQAVERGYPVQNIYELSLDDTIELKSILMSFEIE